MLKQRQDGLVFLHSLVLDAFIIGLFSFQVIALHTAGTVSMTGSNWGIYAVGLLAAVLWNHRALPVMADRLGMLSFRETCRLTRQQLFRLIAVLFAVGFATQDSAISRPFIFWFVAVSAVVLLAANWLLPRLLARFLFRGLECRILVLASADEVSRLKKWLEPRKHLGHRLVGYVSPAGRVDAEEAGALGCVADLRRLLVEQRINQVIVDRAQFSNKQTRAVLAEAARAGCRVRYFIDLQAKFGDMAAVECNEDYAFASETPEPLDNPINALLKRALDLAVALPVVVFILPPLTLAVWLMQRAQSPGPVFYRQERSGRNRTRFHIFKYRTMHIDADRERSRQATIGDPRVYPFGRFLRHTSLDEFPQFLNVLLGDMSVSGPRPHLLEHDREFAAIVDTYYQRHFVKPGITGLAQSEGFRGEVVGRPELLRQRIARDLRYMKMWSLELDLKILAATAAQVVRPPRTAY